MWEISPVPDRVLTRHEVSRDELAVIATEIAGTLPRYRIDQIWEGWYLHGLATTEITTLPAGLRRDLDARLPAALEPVTERVSDGGDTIKQVWSLHDGHLIESVLMLYRDRATVCVSSQAGCAMGCGFCATGQAGFDRHLQAGEILEQIVRAARGAKEHSRRLSNVVFMGMGEPLANEAAVWTAIERAHGDIGLSARHLTVSTVGIIPGIRTLTTRPLPVNLAVSLHAANDTLRDELVPINRRYPLDDLMAACDDYLRVKGRRLSFEWAMIAGVNDRDSDALELAQRCRSLRLAAHVNLIPLNATPGWPTVGSTPERVAAFRDRLETLGVNATVRANRGTDIDAACGQLAAGVRRTPATASVTLSATRSGR